MKTSTQQLAEMTTLRVGGPANFLTINTEAELVTAVSELTASQSSWRILGGGSNILAPDAGVTDTVLHMNIQGQTSTIDGDTVLLTVGAGETLDDVVAATVEHGWWGIENLSHIPGTVGGVPIQNVGAYGVEARDVVSAVRVFNAVTLEFETLTTADCQFRYRDSLFKHTEGKHLIVTAVTFSLSSIPRPQLTYRDVRDRFTNTTPTQADIRHAVIDIRARKFPDWHTVGTAGSFFKNPIVSAACFARLRAEYPDVPGFALPDNRVKVPLGWILDNVLSLKGQGTDTVGLHEAQALVLINRGQATASEIVDFATSVVTKVKAATDIDVEWEVTRW